MEHQKYITVLINKENEVFLPHNRVNGHSFLRYSNPTLTKFIKFGFLEDELSSIPYDFDYIIGYIPYEPNLPYIIMYNLTMTITKVVTSWADGDALKGRTLHKKIGDIDYNSICREVNIDDILA